MTRLIDADALVFTRVRIAHEDGTIGGYNAVVMSSEIKNAPNIDAIPIEFIQKRIDQLKEMNERIFIANGGYTSPSDYEQWELERLIRDWREQNG